MHNITTLFSNIPNSGLPTRQANEYVDFGQDNMFFQLAVAKHARIKDLRIHYSQRGIRKVFLSANLADFQCALPGVEVSIMEKHYFQENDQARLAQKQAELQDAVVIINNNDVGTPQAQAAYAAFYNACTTTCFVAWDWDNHHWLELSTFLAAHSDVYAPAHHENLYLLSRYNWLTAGPVYCSSVQWPRAFLEQQLETMLQAERIATPLGMHIPYAQFKFRIQVIQTLSQHYQTIGFSSRSFHVRTPEDRLREWYSHKTHWIAPVLNDVPIRIFDALITGGIPIVPDSLRLLPPVRAIPREYIAFYSAVDVVEPQQVVARANRLFDEGGREGILARHRYALSNHHGDHSVETMLGFVRELLAPVA